MTKLDSTLYSQLQDAHILKEVPQTSAYKPLWYITMLQAFSGWMASLFLLLFLGVIFGSLLDDSPLLLFISGLSILFFVQHILQSKRGELLEHFALSMSLTAQVMVIISISLFLEEPNLTLLSLFVALFQLLLIVRIRNYIHTLLSGIFMILALY